MHLTIVMAVYNKEKTIKRAIDSILKQKTKFSYKILIIDDCSKDGSVNIIRDYIEKYPDKIEFYQNKRNMRYLGTVLRACEKLDTPYWTLLDPDDYWISDSNIEDAVSFLDTNGEFSLYATNAKKVTDTGIDLGEISIQESGVSYDLKNSVCCPYTHTSATFYRNYYKKKDIDKLKEFIGTDYEKAVEGDTFRNFWHLNKGKGHYLNIVKSVYEVDGKGIYTGLNDIERDTLNLQIFFFSYLFFGNKIKLDFLKIARYYLTRIYSSINYLILNEKYKIIINDIVDQIDYLEKENQSTESSFEHKSDLSVNNIELISEKILCNSNAVSHTLNGFADNVNTYLSRMTEERKMDKKYYLFKFIEVLRITYRNRICRVTLFGIIPILKIRCYQHD